MIRDAMTSSAAMLDPGGTGMTGGAVVAINLRMGEDPNLLALAESLICADR